MCGPREATGQDKSSAAGIFVPTVEHVHGGGGVLVFVVVLALALALIWCCARRRLSWGCMADRVGGFLLRKVFDIRLCMFPSCSHCFTGLRTYFVSSVAQLLPMLVNVFGFNGNFNGKTTKINKMVKNHFSGVQNGSQGV